MCSICQEDDGDGMHELDCGHTFHVKCIVDWFRHGNSTCPMCRDNAGVTPLDGFTIRARARYIAQIGRRKHAPPELKKVVEQWRASKQALQRAAREVTAYRRQHRTTLSTLARLQGKRHAASLRLRRRERMMGCFHDSEYPLPPLAVYHDDFFSV